MWWYVIGALVVVAVLVVVLQRRGRTGIDGYESPDAGRTHLPPTGGGTDGGAGGF